MTEIVELPDRGHSPTIDSGRHEVAQTSLDLGQVAGIPGIRVHDSAAQKRGDASKQADLPIPLRFDRFWPA